MLDRWGFRRRGLIGMILLGSAGILSVFSRPLIAEGTWWDLTLDLIGWVAFILGLVFRFWSTLYVGGRKFHTLVSTGPYSLCRNPLYFGSFLLAISAGLFLQSLTFAFALVVATLAYVRWTVPIEEEELRRSLGAAYEEYCKRVPRYWPRWSIFATPETVEVKIRGLRIEAKRALVWIWLPIAGELVTRLRGEAWWPCLFNVM